MAITEANLSINEQEGQDPMSPTAIFRMSMAGDAAYATGGSAAVEASLAESLTRHSLSITSVSGYGLTAGALTHTVRYDAGNDKLIAYVLATGAEVADAADLSAVTFDLTFICR